MSVDLAPEFFTICTSLAGLSKSGHGRSWLWLKGWLRRYSIKSGDMHACKIVLSFILESE